MQLGDQQASGNVEDRRGLGVGGGLGIGGIVIAAIAYFMGFDPGTAIQVGQQVSQMSEQRDTRAAPKGAPVVETRPRLSVLAAATSPPWS